MTKIFVAIYDDASKEVSFKCYQKEQIILYRTANMGFIEEISQIGYEPTAILLEEDMTALQAGKYENSDITQDDLDFLHKSYQHWAIA